jgi:type III restriction enzyme
VRIDDGRGPDDLLNLVVEIKGYRKEDAKEKANTMRTQWVPGVNNLKTHGRWAHAEFMAVFEMEKEFDELIARFVAEGEKV